MDIPRSNSELFDSDFARLKLLLADGPQPPRSPLYQNCPCPSSLSIQCYLTLQSLAFNELLEDFLLLNLRSLIPYEQSIPSNHLAKLLGSNQALFACFPQFKVIKSLVRLDSRSLPSN